MGTDDQLFSVEKNGNGLLLKQGVWAEVEHKEDFSQSEIS